MRILEIKNLSRRDSPIHYINEYTGAVIFQTVNELTMEKKISFSLELDAIGNKNIKVTLLEDIDYPLIPVIDSVKNFVLGMDQEGLLP